MLKKCQYIIAIVDNKVFKAFLSLKQGQNTEKAEARG